MKRLYIGFLLFTSIAACIFIGSRFVNAHGDAQRLAQSNSKEVIKDPCREYIDDGPFRTKLNGQKLDLDHVSRFEWDIADAKIKLLSTGKMLVGAGDNLYLLDDKKQIEWKLTVPQTLFDYAAIESTGLVYISAGDNNMLIADLASGKKVYRDSRNGSAAYGQVEPYVKDQCLILDNYEGYRSKMSEEEKKDPKWWTPELMGDGITAWRGAKQLWHRDFPPDAELLVKGDKIYAVTKTKTNIYTREISVPEK